MFVRQAKESNYYFVLKSFYFNNQVVDKKLWRRYLKLKDYDWNTLRPVKLYLSIINKHLFHIFSIFLAIQPTGAGTKKVDWIIPMDLSIKYFEKGPKDKVALLKMKKFWKKLLIINYFSFLLCILGGGGG